MIKVGVLGTGYWGKNLLRNYDVLGALQGFFDTSSEQQTLHAADYPNATVYPSVDALLADDAIEALAIATPAITHGALVRRSLEAGKHVFVEKPLCLDIDEAEELRDLAEKGGRTLMVGHLLLYHPAFRAVKDLVAKGTLGKLRYIYSNRLSLGKIRREENALWSFAPHDISMILSLAGRMPSRVVASAGHFLDHKVADTTLSHLTFDDNLQAHVFVSWLHPYKDQRLIVVGESGMVAFNDVAAEADKVLFYPHDVGWRGEVPVLSRADAEPVDYRPDEPLRIECEAFLEAVERGTPPPSDAAEGIRVLKVLQACQDAIISGNKVVF